MSGNLLETMPGPEIVLDLISENKGKITLLIAIVSIILFLKWYKSINKQLK